MKTAERITLSVIALVAVAVIVRFFPVGDASPPRATDDDDREVVIETAAFTLVGAREGEVTSFLGVPYASPPIGERRFRPPEPLPPAREPIDARRAGPLCPQIPSRGLIPEPGEAQEVVGDEDCLRLDLWTRLDGLTRPVMVFVHGGAFQRGGGNEVHFGRSELVRRGEVVLVTLHYRLGALGMIALDALADESETHSTGNYAIRDQIAALEWVHDNIAALGGDPSRVTIFGESAGGESICALMASPLSEGLFSRAISESGGGCARWPTPHEGIDGRLSGVGRGEQIATAAGCTDPSHVAQCLRGLDARALVRAGTRGEHRLHFPVFGPVIDGTVLTASTSDRLERGEIDLPLMVGSNADEASAFTVLTSVQPETYAARMAEIAGPQAEAALAIWPVDLEGTARASFQRAFGELLFGCPAEDLARAAGGGEHPAYLYQFARSMPGAMGQRFGAFHGVELFYLFASPLAERETPADDRSVIDTMQAAWTGFATGGAPHTTPSWPAYRADAPAIFRIDATSSVVTDVSEGRCARAREAGIRLPL